VSEKSRHLPLLRRGWCSLVWRLLCGPGVIEGSVVHERDLERLLRQEDPRTGELCPTMELPGPKSLLRPNDLCAKELSIYYMMADFETQKAIYKMLERQTAQRWSTPTPTPARFVGVRRRRYSKFDGLVGAGTFHSTTRPVRHDRPGSFPQRHSQHGARDGVVSALDAKEVFSLQGVLLPSPDRSSPSGLKKI